MSWSGSEWAIAILATAVAVQGFSLTRVEKRLARLEREMAHRQDPDPANAKFEDIRRQVTPLIQQDRKIAAIKVVRQGLGCTLLEAKAKVDEWARLS